MNSSTQFAVNHTANAIYFNHITKKPIFPFKQINVLKGNVMLKFLLLTFSHLKQTTIGSMLILFASLTFPFASAAAQPPEAVTIEIRADVAYLDEYNEKGCFIETIGIIPQNDSNAYACREYTWLIINPTNKEARYIEISDAFDKTLQDLTTADMLAKIIKIKTIETSGIEPDRYEDGVFYAYAPSIPPHGTVGIRIRAQIEYEQPK